ncbi:MAG: adenylosuccinate lyase [Candidatus Sericytochromatia bacterium]|nr:adenylosuccinate lyase [Candidatus Sericytochromatia bacterium]
MTTHHALTPLTAISPLDGRYRSRVESLAAYVSESALIRQRIAVEVAYFLALLEHLGLVTGDALDDATGRLWGIAGQLAPDDVLAIKAIERHTRHDVKAVEYWLKEQAKSIAPLAPHLEKIHLGLTSEDVNNLAYGRMYQFAVREVVLPRVQQLLGVLGQCAEAWADVPMLALTHGQAATPTTLGKEMAVFGERLRRAIANTAAITLSGKLNGATGTWGALCVAFPDVDWPAFSDAVIRKMGLEPNRLTTQIEPNDRLAELFDSLRRINSILLDLSRDLWLYVSRHVFQLQAVAGEVGSSAMPHKVNPIDFENAEGNLGIANALLGHLADTLTQSRLQRDLSGSTVMRNGGVALAHGFLAIDSLLIGFSRLQPNGAVLAKELADHPEVLAEAIQTVLRAHGVEAPYEQLKALTRGQTVTLDDLHRFIGQVPLDAQTLARLLAMQPGDYVGLAPQLARAAAAEIRMALPGAAAD